MLLVTCVLVAYNGASKAYARQGRNTPSLQTLILSPTIKADGGPLSLAVHDVPARMGHRINVWRLGVFRPWCVAQAFDLSLTSTRPTTDTHRHTDRHNLGMEVGGLTEHADTQTGRQTDNGTQTDRQTTTHYPMDQH
jgi:hypothetical protein